MNTRQLLRALTAARTRTLAARKVVPAGFKAYAVDPAAKKHLQSNSDSFYN